MGECLVGKKGMSGGVGNDVIGCVPLVNRRGGGSGRGSDP